MFGLIDRLAGAWLDWRTERAVASMPEVRDLGVHRVEWSQGCLEVQLAGSMVAYLAEETIDLLKQSGAENYIQFDLLPRPDHGFRPIRVTVQWADGESPSIKAARLAREADRLSEAIGRALSTIQTFTDGDDALDLVGDILVEALRPDQGQ